MGLNPGGKRESPVLLAGACSERANHIALDIKVDKCKIEEPQNLKTWKLRKKSCMKITVGFAVPGK